MAVASGAPLAPPERVLPTLNPDGSRQWIRPKPSGGRYLRARRAVAYALMVVFFLIPYLRLRGKPLILLDLPRREFTLFGTTFLPSETLLFVMLFLSAVIAILLLTVRLGRVWCGWACPQTVYMEFLFRPLERFIEGGWRASRRLDRQGGLAARRAVKLLIYVPLALFLSHTFLAYFVGVEQLAQWVRRSPVEHPVSFLVMLGTAALVYFDFAYFREQTCLVACPYGRLQSALLDRGSLIVGYDTRRGEPRMKGMKPRPENAGDCIDCGVCVLTCPTGIDIRSGLQMECIHCTQCMDACDFVMARIGKPPGLIRYGTQDELEGRPRRRASLRLVLYPLMFAATFGYFLYLIGTRAEAEVTLLRGLGSPYTLEPDGSVVNQIRVKVTNRGARERRFGIEIAGDPQARMIAPINPLPVAAGRSASTSVFVVLPADHFEHGEHGVTVRLSDGSSTRVFPYRLVGPEEDEATEAHGKEEP
jgi:cytochrome c oxidase accessory protein FixG